VGIQCPFHSSSTASSLRDRQNDKRYLRSQCADAPVFKMRRFAKGELYDARMIVKNFVDCEEAVFEAYDHKLSGAVAQRQVQCLFVRHVGWRDEARAAQGIIWVRKSTRQNHSFRAPIRCPEVSFTDAPQCRCGRKTFVVSTKAFLRADTQFECRKLFVCRNNMGHVRDASAIHTEYVSAHNNTYLYLMENPATHLFSVSHEKSEPRCFNEDRTIGERNLVAPWGFLSQLMELTTNCSDCAPAHAPCSAIYALHLSHHAPPPPHGA